MKMIKINKEDQILIQNLSSFLKKHYSKGRHHVASALVAEDGKIYYALHLDIRGFDVCAEPISMTNALIDGQSKFKKIVAVIMTEKNEIEVVNPCGNCRQMLYSYAPTIEVITNKNGKLCKNMIESLFPLPY